MEKGRFKRLSVFIVITMLLTVAIQFYRNIQVYKSNKDWLQKEVSLALNKAMDKFFIEETSARIADLFEQSELLAGELDTTGMNSQEVFQNMRRIYMRNLELSMINTFAQDSSEEKRGMSRFTQLENGVEWVSLESQSSLNDLMSHLNPMLETIGVSGEKKLLFLENGTVIQETEEKDLNHYRYTSSTGSTYWSADKEIVLKYNVSFVSVFLLGLTDVFFSVLMVVCFLIALYSLYKMIFRQKELASMKDDLLANITHEFKTPIAAGVSSLEGITLYNKENDASKNLKFANLAILEMKKMDQLVEKLLETSSMEADQFQMNRREINVSELTQSVVNEFEKGNITKAFELNLSARVIWAVDDFYFKNALSNLIDNALKYGGNKIEISLKTAQSQLIIEVSDNGQGIDKKHAEHIFDKFHRIPQGNLHDVKGYGIGLYAARKIIEQHSGELILTSDYDNTTFRIILNQ